MKTFILVLLGLLGVVSVVNAGSNKVSICHRTGSENNPFVLISVSSNAVQMHLGHGDKLLPLGENDCSGGGPVPG